MQGNVEVSVSPSTSSAVSTGFSIADDGALSVASERWGGWLGKLLDSFLGFGVQLGFGRDEG